jgi:thermitase
MRTQVIGRALSSLRVCLFLLVAASVPPVVACAQSYVPNRVLVQFVRGTVALPESTSIAELTECTLDTNLASAMTFVGADTVASVYPGSVLADTLQFVDDSTWVTVPDVSQLFIITLTPGSNVFAAIDSLLRDPRVLYAEPDYIGTLAAIPNDTEYGEENQVSGPKSAAPQSTWDYQTGAQSIRVALLDTGIDYTQPDFGDVTMGTGKHIPLGYDWVDHDSDPRDTNDHGTFAAGEIGACTNNARGIAGIAGGWSYDPATGLGNKGVSLYPVRIAGTDGVPLPSSTIANALREAAAGPGTVFFFGRPLIGAHVIHVNIERLSYNETMRGAINYAARLGRTVVMPKGNTTGGALNYPSDYDHEWIISVGGINEAGANIFNTGNGIDVVALGDYNYSLNRSGGYNHGGGTSFSGPLVVGEAALLLSMRSDLHPGEVEGIIRATATRPTPENYTDEFGSGLINIGKATSLLRGSWSLARYTATGGGYVNHTGSYQLSFADVPGAPAAGTHFVQRYDVRKTVGIGSAYKKGVYVYGRGPSATLGWSDVGDAAQGIRSYATGYCNVTAVDTVAQTAELQTFVYYVTDVNHSYWAPCAPSAAVLAYSVSQRDIPLAVSITGVDSLSESASGTWTAVPVGGSGGYTYQWRWRTNPTGSWSSVVGTSSTYTRTMTTASFQLQISATSAGQTVTGTKWVYFRSSGGGCADCEDPPIIHGAGKAGVEGSAFRMEDGAVRLRILLGAGQSPMQLRVYNVMGKLVRTIKSGEVAPGWHDVEWTLQDNGGSRVRPGVYFVALDVAGLRRVRRVVLLP